MRTVLLLLPAIALLSGCASVTYERVNLGPDGKVTSKQREHASAFFMKGAVDRLRSNTKDGAYTHSFSANGMQGQGDAEMITATSTGLGKFTGETASTIMKGMGIPALPTKPE